MTDMLKIFQSYIQEGSLSISSQTDQGVDSMHTFQGMYWQRNVVKLVHINSYLYLAKGTADYVGVWDLDEFFIPRKPYNSMLEVLRVMEAPDQGQADGDDHPYCYLSLSSRVVLKTFSNLDYQHLWLGERFPHGTESRETKIGKRMGFKKQFLPTRTIFQAGLHMSGACRLPYPFNGCPSNHSNGFCFQKDFVRTPADELMDAVFFHSYHRFDEVVMDSDYKKIDEDIVGGIYHFYSTHRVHFNLKSRPISSEALNHTNDYTARFFSGFRMALRAKILK
eukprot:CAMPEP_0182437780 /NCGR_PEP_ID=MMETSP1167-20130531/85278_1 /TAXON_ID=2988 /ORGANISM="Mallomonas Sp, Strain CCMP3275" /LENGTH=278 /DNA_ID=CAMNT_0024630819 /DNA_START=165 /DNA_END=1001 /DNA_ORIENTATION=-